MIENTSAQGLIRIINNLNRIVVGVEVGVANGDNFVNMLENCPNIKLLVGVDPWIPYSDNTRTISKEESDIRYEATRKKILKFGERARIMRKKSNKASIFFDNETLDFIFIDGNHDYKFVLRDLKIWYPKIKISGIIAGHDRSLLSVQKALKEFNQDNKYTIKNILRGSWYFIKE